MGKKKTEPETSKAEDAKPEAEEEDEPKIVKDLKEIDDKYLAIEREYEKEVQELQKKYTEKQQPFLEQRMKLLTDKSNAEEADKSMGTPACRGFWLQAMKNLPALEEHIEEWDEAVLEYCFDIRKEHLDQSDLQKGYKLSLRFVENPYFTNDTLWKEYYTKEGSPYTGEIETEEIKVCEIGWKAGQNVTVETVAKKVKGGGAKKAKAKGKVAEEPRDSFFRNFFRNLKPGMELPDDINLEEARALCDEEDEEDDEGMIELLMENDYEIGCCIRDQLVPFAVRWYTGEAAPDDDDDDFDEDDEEDDDDDDDEEEDDDDEDEDDEPPPKKGQPKKKGGGGKGDGKGGGKNAEECKQQ